ncbi:hypothetical protein CRM22_007968 [Opisthorchis felineus]|uniref:MSP domain-containing protein n=1 Tax=Opisthorchis felineus TaxID=147828 RepID=A0A4S2LDD4_OPIFE|nr:hypothetical protein CRM22_007968 [Opisthorchis felineus]
MGDNKTQLIEIEPREALYFEGPFTDVVTSHIQLTNLQDQSVCFKVKTTVPKRYCVRPSSGVLKPHERLNVAVMLQPFNYDPAEKAKHKFMIQSMPMPDGDSTPLEEVWQYAHPNKIRDSKLICVLRLPGELVVEPSHDLVFEGPFNKPSSATVTLTNPSRDQMWFKLHVFSQKLSASPVSAVLQPNESVKVTVTCKPMDSSDLDRPRERVLIKSLTISDSETRPLEEVVSTAQTTDTFLKCVFSGTQQASDEKVKPIKVSHSHASHAEPTVKGPTVESLLTEIASLRNENKALKEADIQLRRAALSDTCLNSAAGGGAAIGRHGAWGAIASIPPILYLILALLIGLFLGKFAL